MNPNPPLPQKPSPDPALSELLRSWEVDGTLPRAFAQQVHQRIAEDRKPRRHFFSAWIEPISQWISLLQHPAVAATYITAGILLGALSGSRHAQTRSAVHEVDPQVRYVASIDPYQMTRFLNP